MIEHWQAADGVKARGVMGPCEWTTTHGMRVCLVYRGRTWVLEGAPDSPCAGEYLGYRMEHEALCHLREQARAWLADHGVQVWIKPWTIRWPGGYAYVSVGREYLLHTDDVDAALSAAVLAKAKEETP
jgi:hypothetical protein